MSIIRRFAFRNLDSTKPSHFREAWWDEGEFVIHYGKLGDVGTTKTEQVSEEEGEHLLAGFLAQDDDFRELTDAEIFEFEARLKLRGATPNDIEISQAEKLATRITRILAWRGVGEVQKYELAKEYFRFIVETPHPSKAKSLLPIALSATDIRPHRFSIHKVEA